VKHRVSLIIRKWIILSSCFWCFERI